MPKQFEFIQLEKEPIFDITPCHARVGTCYRDLKGMYHLFIHYYGASTRPTWIAEVRYYRSADLKDWQFVETAVPPVNFVVGRRRAILISSGRLASTFWPPEVRLFSSTPGAIATTWRCQCHRWSVRKIRPT